ncbi:DNA-binding protein [bacterium (Candidatus Gribaldobacteria) CG_4_10_14_0_2_um_filter_36_18]|uniref:DNA-binding protein n=1 Tax=bacterium (Candidatus Gribaldobacteria) CG_4_10_14_0_2_um_filter_36_18 TaxID=2014264 RepID=A0A2M7VKM6_9BACT|nr:MAG: DNA-binding protein [bacterium (Candidatus Gribaldobacteria) CG_4_10_14_0_2_um_filter_36_18]
MQEISKKLGKNFKRIRIQKGMSQGDIYRSIGMDRAYLSSLENGKRNPTLSNIKKIAEALDVEPFELLK